ncbi:hypothetical protein ES288_D11G140500v1 [Gossypium darwinii]|uniref:HECT-type E3 ubiquitin transferase n=2 Tax=Gossypium TaxID=3633 RepID=A0A5D2IM35_GOSTO|nr:hypothetical protein ES288_D11G140500v1 [Gossypium darwinii]TYH43604.1 hypothetical protein ES332_D11G138100v1 [Gossypium tomentosum]
MPYYGLITLRMYSCLMTDFYSLPKVQFRFRLALSRFLCPVLPSHFPKPKATSRTLPPNIKQKLPTKSPPPLPFHFHLIILSTKNRLVFIKLRSISSIDSPTFPFQSYSRAPLLGFKYLQPAFTIHKVASDAPLWAAIGGSDVEQLPSASTCYNTIKLPTYKRSSTLKANLRYAINSNAGFELS